MKKQLCFLHVQFIEKHVCFLHVQISLGPKYRHSMKELIVEIFFMDLIEDDLIDLVILCYLKNEGTFHQPPLLSL